MPNKNRCYHEELNGHKVKSPYEFGVSIICVNICFEIIGNKNIERLNKARVEINQTI